MKTNRIAIIFVILIVLLLIASGLTNPVLQPISITSLAEKDGFWSLEFSGDRYYRWTKGDTLFQLSGFETASSLYVILNLTAPQYSGATPIDAWMQVDRSPAIRFSIATEWRRYYILTSVTEPRWHTPLLKLVTDTWTPGIHDQRQLGVAVSGGAIQRINSPRIFAVLERALFLAVLIAFFYTTVRYLQSYGSLLIVFVIVILGVIGVWVPSRLAQVLPTNWSLVSAILAAAITIELVRLRRKISRDLLYIVAMMGVITGALFISVLGWIIAGVVFVICSVLLSAIIFTDDEIRQSRSLYPLILTIGFYSFSILTLVYWHQSERYEVTGDEPHYLVMADGIISYGTFEQTKPYKKELEEKNIWRGKSPLDPHVIAGPNGSYNVHNIGLPLLISVPYKLGSDMSNILPRLANYNVYGIGAVKLFLITTAGLIVIGSWILSGFFLDNIKARVITVVAIVYGYPFIPASGQIYPEFTAGTILFFAIIYLILSDTKKDIKSSFFSYIIYIATSFLPWLHIKLSVPALIAACSLMISERKSGRNLLYSLQPLIFLLLSLMLLASYNSYAFGNIFGPYKGGALVINATSVMVLFGLHFDRFHGIFFQNIAYLIIPFYVISFYKRFSFVSLVILSIYASIVVPNALHPAWYGGWSFAGRFQWTGAIVLIPLVVYGFSRILQQRPKIGFPLALFTISLNAIIYLRYTFSDFELNNGIGYQSFIPAIDRFLPALRDSKWAYSYLVNYVWVSILLFVILIIVVYHKNIRGKTFSTFSASGFLFLGVVLFITATYFQSSIVPIRYFYLGNQLPSRIGLVSGTDIIVTDSVKASDFLSYGPYCVLPPGNYVATFEYVSDETSKTNIGWIDITANFRTISRQTIHGTNGVPIHIEISFTLQDVQQVEARFWYDGPGTVSLKSLEIRSK